MRHIPVLLEEVLSFIPKSAMNVVDCTVGDAGHAEALLERFPECVVLGIDADPRAVEYARGRLKRFAKRAHVINGNFGDAEALIKKVHIFTEPTVDVLFADLGWSTPQFSERGRGFSFEHMDEPLDMRLNPHAGMTAASILTTASEDELGRILRVYGEEKAWKPIAHAVVHARARTPLKTVSDLVTLIKPFARHGRLHPATLVFQALRIAVNNELEQLRELLLSATRVVRTGGFIVLISFHSLEHKVIKEFFAEQSTMLRAITKKPIVPGALEIKHNPRARSAQLRVFQKLS